MLPRHTAKRRRLRPRAPSFGAWIVALTLTTFLHRPAYEAWSLAKIYWLPLAHPTPRPAVCGPESEPAGAPTFRRLARPHSPPQWTWGSWRDIPRPRLAAGT